MSTTTEGQSLEFKLVKMAQTPGKKNKLLSRRTRLTFRRTVDDLVLLLRVFEDTLGAEHFFVDCAVELDFFLGMGLAVLDD